MRKTKEELQDLMIQNGVSEIYSWSRIQSYHLDPYSYFLKYVKRVPPDRGDSSYTFLGSAAHALLEDFYDGKVTNEQMIEQFEDKVSIQEISGIRFSANDDQNENIKNNYVTCIKHFFKEYQKDKNALLEQYVYGFIDKYFFGGYVDKMHKVDDILFIDDFKTSTIYNSEKIENDKGQLYIYAILMHLMYNIPYDKIRVRWNFLKYVKLTYTQINGKQTVSYIKRNELGNSLKGKARTWLAHEKYSEEEIDQYIDEMIDLNANQMLDKGCISHFPDKIKEKFKIEDGNLEVSIDENEVNNFISRVGELCDQIKNKVDLYNTTNDEHLFWSDVNDKNSYYYANLCNYSIKYHRPYSQYIENLEEMKSNNPIDDDFLTKLFS